MRSSGLLATALLIFCSAMVLVARPVHAGPPSKPTPQFEFELVMEKGLPLTAPQKWQQVLSELKASGVQIRSPRDGDKPGIEQGGTARQPVFRIRGTLTAGNQLSVPGGKFSAEDRAGIAKWMRELGENGVEGVTVKKSAFNLTPSQLEAIHDDLAHTVDFSTKGLPPGEAIGKIRASLKFTLAADEGLTDLFKSDARLDEELQGLTAGTAIAAILRPAGAVLLPHKPAGGELGYRVSKAVAGVESWPVGWPTEVAPNKTVPTLFEFLNVEFEKVPQNEVIEAIQGRIKVPLLMDQNSIAAQQIDLAKPVNVPVKKTFYARILEDVLFKNGLKYEIRVDEAEKPFLWITTLRRQ